MENNRQNLRAASIIFSLLAVSHFGLYFMSMTTSPAHSFRDAIGALAFSALLWPTDNASLRQRKLILTILVILGCFVWSFYSVYRSFN